MKKLQRRWVENQTSLEKSNELEFEYYFLQFAFQYLVLRLCGFFTL